MSLFTFGTLLASLAPVLDVLLLARMIQVSGFAIVMPLFMNVSLVLSSIRFGVFLYCFSTAGDKGWDTLQQISGSIGSALLITFMHL